MENNNWFFSDEYKKMIENINRITNSISPQFEAIRKANLQLGSILQTNINQDTIHAITGIKSKIPDFTKYSKQLLETLPAFQLSEEVRKFIQETKESEKLSEDEFEKKYGEEFEICRTLGEHGWVVSGHSNPRDIKNWYDHIVTGESEKIVDFFEEENGIVISNIQKDLEKKYTDPNNKKYFSRGYEAFQNGDYMTSAMYLVALLEARVDRLVQFPPNTKYKDKYSNKGFVDVKKEQFEQASSFFTKRYYFLDVYPSLIAFLNRLFVDGEYKFGNKIEPPYINRNWLLHGRSSREIERWECIQLLNALDTIENVLSDKSIAEG